MNKLPVTQHGVRVPYAKDGTCFSPSVRMVQTNSFVVGTKDNEVTFEMFDEALAYLQRMSRATWRRPNDAGIWCRVRAVRWGELH